MKMVKSTYANKLDFDVDLINQWIYEHFEKKNRTDAMRPLRFSWDDSISVKIFLSHKKWNTFVSLMRNSIVSFSWGDFIPDKIFVSHKKWNTFVLLMWNNIVSNFFEVIIPDKTREESDIKW